MNFDDKTNEALLDILDRRMEEFPEIIYRVYKMTATHLERWAEMQKNRLDEVAVRAAEDIIAITDIALFKEKGYHSYLIRAIWVASKATKIGRNPLAEQKILQFCDEYFLERNLQLEANLGVDMDQLYEIWERRTHANRRHD